MSVPDPLLRRRGVIAGVAGISEADPLPAASFAGTIL